MAEFVEITEDKFDNTISYMTSHPLGLYVHLGSHIGLNFHRTVFMPNGDFIWMSITHNTCNDKLLYLNQGEVILLLDGEKVLLTPNGNWQNREVRGTVVMNTENCSYNLDRHLLKRICDSNTLAMRVSSGHGVGELSNVNAFIVYAKLFYNAVYDNTAYTDVVRNALSEFTRTSASDSRFEKIQLDGSGAKATGCMGTVALLIALGLGSIYGICTII